MGLGFCAILSYECAVLLHARLTTPPCLFRAGRRFCALIDKPRIGGGVTATTATLCPSRCAPQHSPAQTTYHGPATPPFSRPLPLRLARTPAATSLPVLVRRSPVRPDTQAGYVLAFCTLSDRASYNRLPETGNLSYLRQRRVENCPLRARGLACTQHQVRSALTLHRTTRPPARPL